MTVTPPPKPPPPPSAPLPQHFQPSSQDPKTQLMGRVEDALRALPGYFGSSTNVEGIQATDLFSLNTMLGATLEVQVVETLNRMRDVWDPDDNRPLHRFDRQAQTFPDVLLRRQTAQGFDVALGIELKGWYVLSKEKEPSFRYSVSPGACTKWDLLAVIPWHLSNVLSGTPKVGAPGLWSAQHTAAYRNWWWEHERKSKSDPTIDLAKNLQPYQQRSHTSDRPNSDKGGNFGRIARIGIMDTWVQDTLKEPLAGIPTHNWIDFLLVRISHVSASGSDDLAQLLAGIPTQDWADFLNDQEQPPNTGDKP